MEIKLENGMSITVESLIDRFGVGVKILYDVTDDPKTAKVFYFKLSADEAKTFGLLLARSFTR